MKKELEITLNTPTNDTAKVKVAYVSTTATEKDLYDFAAALSNLTTNTFVSVNLITTKELAGE